MAGFVVALVYQLGTSAIAHVPRGAAIGVCGAAAIAAIVMDARAIHRRTYAVGLKRQTAKALAHDEARLW